MTDRIQFNEKQMRDAILFMREYVSVLDELNTEMMKLGTSIQSQGALVGSAGQALEEAVARDLTGVIQKLRERFDKEARYVENELRQLKRAASRLR